MADVTPYQIIVPLAALLMVAYAWNLVVRQKKTIWEGCLWTLFWCTIGYVAVEPRSLQVLSSITGIKRNEYAAVFTAIVILFFIVFYMILRIEALEQRIVKITRERALKDAGIQEKENSADEM